MKTKMWDRRDGTSQSSENPCPKTRAIKNVKPDEIEPTDFFYQLGR